ncbi:GumC family protein [Dyadobacter aurulentus]|uniref:GumC family protein n=1 Tax=Dyadobacter sp. UC 10 TaxID=2605428 RepID=UPI0011F2873F|nr:tyrosine-protein kinase [Dyadobacter sp. UC 10]KAA0990031.1 polysaccharide biosynthesis tyrosine autokinase [Dyadobacter sp. UC 10]
MADENLALVTSLRPDGNSVFDSEFLKEIFQRWPLFLFCLLASLLVAAVFLRYATPQYLVESSLLIRDDSRGANFEDAAALENLGLSSVSSSIDNEIEILRSRSLVESIVDALALNISYFAAGSVKTTELYGKSPFTIDFLAKEQLRSKPGVYQVSLLQGNSFRIDNGKKTIVGEFNDTMTLDHGRAIISRTGHIFSPDDNYSVIISDREQVIKALSANLSISVANKFASLIELSIRETIPEKGEAILAALIGQYISNNISDKNRVADNTLAFINENLSHISAELGAVESNIAEFRKANQLLNIEEESRQLIHQAGVAGNQFKEYSIRLKIVDAIVRYIIENPARSIPSSLIQQEANFAELGRKYNDLLLTRTRNLISVNKAHPAILAIDDQIAALRSDLLSALKNQQTELKISLDAFRQNGEEYERDISRIPSRQRVYLDYTRQQQIKQELYLFLLKKQMETSISRSATVGNTKIIDPPKADSNPVTPNRRLVFLISACIGLGIPAASLHFSRILGDRIANKKILIQYCKAPLIADISYQRKTRSQFLQPDSKSLLSEQFRTLRVNMLFASGPGSCQTIMITSGVAGEGKSFVAANLAQSFSINNKKVLLIELDLRKPSLAGYLELDPAGFTEYMFGKADAMSVIQNAGSKEGFDVITSGFPPPNPAELLSTTRFERLMAMMKEKYDHIIIDTPPVGLVSDAHMLRPFVNFTLYVFRQGLSGRQQIEDLNKLFTENRLASPHLIYNGYRQATRHYQYYEGDDKSRLSKWIQNFKLTKC